MTPFDRRRFLQAIAAWGISAVPLARAQAAVRSGLTAYPFTLGVASGYPVPDGFVLWTRLAPAPELAGGGLPRATLPVRWEVATDEAMRNVVAGGTEPAEAAWAHSVHVEVSGLQPGRPYWYRFTVGDAQSPVGRTWTAPRKETTPVRLRYALASCQHYEQGYFGAYRHIVADDPQLVVFVGDYIYEQSYSRTPVRRHNGRKARTLEDYRQRYALYKSDPDLQAAHAACPWIVTWDDHEVENDYAGDQSALRVPREVFLAHRAAAYKAYYEHMPLRHSMRPRGPHATIYTHLEFGQLAMFHVLDNRQYRSPQPCQRPHRGGGNYLVNCAERMNPNATMLGAAQERWLAHNLGASTTRWNIIAQQSLVSQLDLSMGDIETFWTDAWDGYPAARERVLQAIAERRPANPVFLGGDAHMFWVSELPARFDIPGLPAVASEICGTSITSRSLVEPWYIGALLDENPHISFGHSAHRGYTLIEVTPGALRADLRIMETVLKPDAGCRTLASFLIEDGRPGPVRV
jgi:alkaline phosphatase D